MASRFPSIRCGALSQSTWLSAAVTYANPTSCSRRCWSISRPPFSFPSSQLAALAFLQKCAFFITSKESAGSKTTGGVNLIKSKSSFLRVQCGFRSPSNPFAALALAWSPSFPSTQRFCAPPSSSSSSGSMLVKQGLFSAAENETQAWKMERLVRWIENIEGFVGHGILLQCSEPLQGDEGGVGGRPSIEGGAKGPVHGMGAFAGKGGVRPGSVIVTVPRMAMMSVETAEMCPEVGPFIDATGINSWQALILHLLFERRRGEESFWAPYIDILPSHADLALSHPLLWSLKDRRKWLHGSPTLAVLETRIDMCREDFEVLRSAGANKLVPPGKSWIEEDEWITEETVKWAAAILLSRAFSLDFSESVEFPYEGEEGRGGETLSLVPWADVLNHSCFASAVSCLAYDPDSDCASLRAHCAYAEGEEVFDSYGPFLNAPQLFLDYGLVSPNPLKFSADLPGRVLVTSPGDSNRSLLAAIGLPIESSVFSFSSEGPDDTVFAWARAALASSADLAAAGWTDSASKDEKELDALAEKAAKVMARMVRPISSNNEEKVRSSLLQAATEILENYPTSAEEDRSFLEKISKGELVVSLGRKLSTELVLTEKTALMASIQMLQKPKETKT